MHNKEMEIEYVSHRHHELWEGREVCLTLVALPRNAYTYIAINPSSRSRMMSDVAISLDI